MRTIFCLTVTTALLSGCATQVWWNLPYGVTEQQFRIDDYACIQQSQQQTSGAYVGPYGGSAHSGSEPNFQLYKACMYAKGYREGKKP